MNRLIARNMQPGQFITFFYALIDGATRQLVCTNAGHNFPILFRRGGDVVRLDKGGLPLGIYPDSTYAHQELVLESGDRLLMFTDGVTELRNAKGEEFGEDRLVALVREEVQARAMHKAVIEAVSTFSGGGIQDDATVLALAIL